MDRPGLRFLILVAAVPAIGAAADSLPIRAARWTAPARLLEALTSHPTECLTMPRDPAKTRAVRVGRIAFRTPLLLGGQAARAGLSCESCHQAGRGNPAFLFPGLSGAPGTADVTASLMSSHRGDGVFNPKPIPDLAGPPASFRRVPDKDPAALLTFIRGLVVEEFDGPEPPDAVLDGLVAYVRALSPQGCGDGAPVPVTVLERVSDARMALTATGDALKADDPATARLMIAGARAQLGLIDERYRRPGLEQARQRLLAFDQSLATILPLIARRELRAQAQTRLAAAQVLLTDLAAKLQAHASTSYFGPAILAQAVAGSR